MATLRVLLCDDEPLALDRLADLLSSCADVEVVGRFLSGAELVAAAATAEADLLLLDIEMPQMDGFDVVEALSRMAWSAERPPPLIVFATARPEFASNAFDFGALDFICKPVRLGRLEQALERARTALARIEAQTRLRDLSEQLDRLKSTHAQADDRRQIWVRSGGEAIRLDVGDICRITAEGEYIRIHAGDASFLERGSLQEAAAALAPFGFVRVHRSTVVNAERIASVTRGRWGQLKLRTRDGAELAVGKKYRGPILDLTRRGLISIAEADG